MARNIPRNLFGRRGFIKGLCRIATLPLLSRVAFAESDREHHRARAKVGAIRWDAWYDPADGTVAQGVEAALGPVQFHFRMPFFGEVTGADRVRINGNSQDIIDREIRCAARAGLDYWAFDAFPPDSPLSNALRFYLNSERRHEIEFCVINGLSSTIAYFQNQTAYLIDLMCQPGYVNVFDNRPLFYAYTISDDQIARDGGAQKIADWITEIRTQVQKRGQGNPYVVLTNEGNFPRAAQLCRTLGLDAVAKYATAPPPVANRTTYEDLVALVEASWSEMAAVTGLPIIPNVMTGWNPAPREIRDHTPPHDYQDAKPEEIARHLERTLDWLDAHKNLSPANTVLIYAWDECDEGFGALVPTYEADDPDGNSARLRAIAPVLRRHREIHREEIER